MNKKKLMNRKFVVVGAILIQLALGNLYAWSVFTTKLVESAWTKTQTQIVFSVGVAVFAIVMVVAGRLMPKYGPRKLTIASAIALGLGYLIAGLLGAENYITTLIFVGILGGAGIGFGYVVPIAVGMRWYPDKKGLITGLAVAGFGFGATLWMTLADKLGSLGGGELIKNIGLSNTFIVLGVIFFIIILIGSIWMEFPPTNWKPEGWKPAEIKSAANVKESVNYSSSEMLKTVQFYLIVLTYAFGAGAGLMSIGLMKLWPMEAMQANGIPKEVAGAAATLAMAIFFALFNGLGRILWGMISDKIGRKISIALMMGTQGVFVILFQWMAGAQVTLYIFAVLIGFNYGGLFSLFPTITADTFGVKYFGQNYGWVFLAYAIGGIIFPILGGKLGDLGNFPIAFTICGILCFVAVVTIIMVKPLKKLE
ncbi:MAG: OFA family MFS transporter [Prolixibacteraceae bacterium]|nr:OFA family MFS transporter [Prolixibacteraceae bacterium]